MEEIIEILKSSVKKNGEILLTNKHLLNILKMAQKNIEDADIISDLDFDSIWIND